MPEVISKAEFARHLGVSKARVSQYCAQGLPVRPDGRLDFVKAKTWVRDNIVNTEANGYAPMGYNHAWQRTRVLAAKAEIAEIEVARLRRELLPADEVEAAWEGAIGRSRALLLGIPPGAAAEIVVIVRGEPADDLAERGVRELLTRQIDAALAELAEAGAESDDDDEDDGAEG